MGKLIVIEGLDGSGKATQSKLLAQNLKNQGKKVLNITFPDYDSDSSALVKMYLKGDFGDKPSDVNAYTASSFYAVDRFASFKTHWEKMYNDDYIIIADRYTTSNAVHQCSKLSENQWKTFLDWLYDFEYNKIGIPEPDMVVYLDMTPKVSQELMTKRYKGDETKKDIHEKDEIYLDKSRKAAYFCLNENLWHKIECDNGKTAYSIEEISNKVLKKAMEII